MLYFGRHLSRLDEATSADHQAARCQVLATSSIINWYSIEMKKNDIRGLCYRSASSSLTFRLPLFSVTGFALYVFLCIHTVTIGKVYNASLIPFQFRFHCSCCYSRCYCYPCCCCCSISCCSFPCRVLVKYQTFVLEYAYLTRCISISYYLSFQNSNGMIVCFRLKNLFRSLGLTGGCRK